MFFRDKRLKISLKYFYDHSSYSCFAIPGSAGPSGRTSTTRRSPPQPRAEPTLAAKAAAEAGDPGSPGAEGSGDHPDRCLAAAFHIPADFS